MKNLSLPQHGDTVNTRQQSGADKYAPRKRQPGEATPAGINLMKLPDYKPAPWVNPVR